MWALAVALVAAPSAVDAQQAERVYRIGWLATAPLEELAKVRPASLVTWQAFVQGLQEHGWIEGRNIVFEFRYSRADIGRLPRLAAELVALNPDVIATGLGEPAIRALKAATTTTPS